MIGLDTSMERKTLNSRTLKDFTNVSPVCSQDVNFGSSSWNVNACCRCLFTDHFLTNFFSDGNVFKLTIIVFTLQVMLVGAVEPKKLRSLF